MSTSFCKANLVIMRGCVHAKSLQLCPTLWTVARQAPLSVGFWSGLPCPPGDLPYLGIKHASLMSPALARGFFTNSATWETQSRNESTMSKRWHLGSGDSCLSPPFFVCCLSPYHPKCVVSCQSEGPCFPLSAYGPLFFIGYVVSGHLAPTPISLLIPSYLCLETKWLSE